MLHDLFTWYIVTHSDRLTVFNVNKMFDQHQTARCMNDKACFPQCCPCPLAAQHVQARRSIHVNENCRMLALCLHTALHTFMHRLMALQPVPASINHAWLIIACHLVAGPCGGFLAEP